MLISNSFIGVFSELSILSSFWGPPQAYDIWPADDGRYLWHGMSVFALDGSKYMLPATEEIRDDFDPSSGLENKGKGHYPQCLVSTVYDVFRRLPVARSVVGNDNSEREEMKKLVSFVPPGSVWMFDRGYPSYESMLFFQVTGCSAVLQAVLFQPWKSL